MELNEQGEYESVETQTKADVLTGGVFMMRQVRIVLSSNVVDLYGSCMKLYGIMVFSIVINVM